MSKSPRKRSRTNKADSSAKVLHLDARFWQVDETRTKVEALDTRILRKFSPPVAKVTADPATAPAHDPATAPAHGPAAMAIVMEQVAEQATTISEQSDAIANLQLEVQALKERQVPERRHRVLVA